MRRIWAASVLFFGGWVLPPAAQAEPDDPPPTVEPVVLAEIPHDPKAFTQGFEIAGSGLWEGTGLAGESQMRLLDPDTGEVLRSAPVPGEYFGEGITVVGDKIWQLTYRDDVAVEWDAATLTPIREVPVNGEGWGLCYDGEMLIRSDGSNVLHFHNPDDMSEIGSMKVTQQNRAINGLNELECVNGQIWANLWPSDRIVRIDQATGAVNLIVNAAGLRARGIPATGQVLNGIAHVAGDEYLLTGKDWPKTFRVQIPGT